MCYDSWKSPVGVIHIYADCEFVHAILFDANLFETVEKLGLRTSGMWTPLLEITVSQLQEYFKGDRMSFDLPVWQDGTRFQKRAWSALQKIPYGSTISYLDQTILMRADSAMRAVGYANSKNAHMIVVPCHRVLKSSGKIGGYAGGVDVMAKLLELEKTHSSVVAYGSTPTIPIPDLASCLSDRTFSATAAVSTALVKPDFLSMS